MEDYNFGFKIDELKRKDELYLRELQIFFDAVDNVQDEQLKKQILYQMHRCEERVILMCKELVNKQLKV